MNRETLLVKMLDLLRTAVSEDGVPDTVEITATSPLVGSGAVLTSIALVSYVVDVEAAVSEDHGLDVTLVNESALSRRNSPFRNVEALADYVLELAGAGSGDGVPESSGASAS